MKKIRWRIINLGSIKKRINWLHYIRFDKKVGFYYYKLFGRKLYIRFLRHFAPESEHQWIIENIFFHYYMPKDGDQIVDLGVGYGEEALYLKKFAPRVKYLGVEAQPAIYECVCNTFFHLGENFRVSPFVISDNDNVKFVSRYRYAGVGADSDGYIEVPTLNWKYFIKRYNLEKIDLLKMNIEGGESEFLQTIDDFSMIKRFIISCHDFKANKGGGEFFSTKEFVTSRLLENGYRLKTFDYGMDWSDDWIYAYRE